MGEWRGNAVCIYSGAYFLILTSRKKAKKKSGRVTFLYFLSFPQKSRYRFSWKRWDCTEKKKKWSKWEFRRPFRIIMRRFLRHNTGLRCIYVERSANVVDFPAQWKIFEVIKERFLVPFSFLFCCRSETKRLFYYTIYWASMHSSLAQFV